MARRRFHLVRRSHFPRARARAVHLARRGVSAGARAAQAEKHTFAALFTALGFGYLEPNLATLPHFKSIGVAGTWGIGTWALARWMRNRSLSHMATGLLAIGARDLGRELSKKKIGDELVGDDIDM